MISLQCASSEAIAQSLNQYLRAHGYSTWICVEMKAGVTYREEIVVNASSSKAFIALMNIKWAESKECRYEFNIATRSSLTKGIPNLIPIVLEQFDWNAYPLLIGLMANTNAIFYDAKHPNLSWEKVVASLKEHGVHGASNVANPAKSKASAEAVPISPDTKEDLPEDIETWNIRHVAQWVQSLDFKPPKEPFVDNWVNGAILLEISEKDMVESLKFTPLQAKRLMKEVISLIKSSNAKKDGDEHQVSLTPTQHSKKGFRTGSWTGWYESGKPPKRDPTSMDITMVAGLIAGYGTDKVGDFLIQGVYDDDQETFKYDKTYIGAHCIIYEGKIIAGVLQGRWSSKSQASWNGPFMLQYTAS